MQERQSVRNHHTIYYKFINKYIFSYFAYYQEIITLDYDDERFHKQAKAIEMQWQY